MIVYFICSMFSLWINLRILCTIPELEYFSLILYFVIFWFVFRVFLFIHSFGSFIKHSVHDSIFVQTIQHFHFSDEDANSTVYLDEKELHPLTGCPFSQQLIFRFDFDIESELRIFSRLRSLYVIFSLTILIFNFSARSELVPPSTCTMVDIIQNRCDA